MFSRVLLLAFAVAVASAQTFSGGSVTNTLPATVGACGRPCTGTITCKQSGYSKVCSGADAAVHHDVFFANYNSSLPAAKNPICGHHFNAIGAISTVTGTVCSFCTEPTCGSSDLMMSDPVHAPGYETGEWILFST